MYHIGSIGQCGTDVLIGELGIFFSDLFGCHSVGQASHDHYHRDTGPLDTRITVMQIFCNDDSILPSYAARLATSSSLCPIQETS